jgi:hypothetical protein
MSFSPWLRNRKTPDSTGHRRAYRTPPKPATFRPQLEALEDRWLPSTLTVRNTNDSGADSLRAAISNAHQQGDTIVFDLPPGQETITLTSGELLIKKNLTIAGPGSDQLTVSGGGLSRVFEVAAKKNVTLSGLTISNGSIMYGSGTPVIGGGVYNHGTLTITSCTLSGNGAMSGGAIYNDLLATLTVTGCTLSGNGADFGGGIYNLGTLTITSCTLSGNSSYDGGAIYNDLLATAAVSGCTLVSNSAEDYGGTIYIYNSTMTVSDCTLTSDGALFTIYVYPGSNQFGSLTVSNSAFSGNGPYYYWYINGPYIDGGGNTFN